MTTSSSYTEMECRDVSLCVGSLTIHLSLYFGLFESDPEVKYFLKFKGESPSRLLSKYGGFLELLKFFFA